ncbi:MAG: hypothetical protein WD271_06330 [Acidimicrobiia bacterium]
MCMQCFWGFEAGVTALGIWRYQHVKRTAHRDLVFELEEEEDWFAFDDAKRAPADLGTADPQRASNSLV